MAALSFFRSFYPGKMVYYAGYAAAALFVLSYFVPVFFSIAWVLLACTGFAVLIDTILLYGKSIGIVAERLVFERLSNGDENKITLQFENRYSFAAHCTIV